MSGHSKWANIKRKKEVNDAKRSQVFSKMARLITVAARKGGGDVNANPALRLAVEKAKYAKMPKENIDKAISKGVGDSSADGYEDVVYEGYGPGGVAFMVETLTDNRNRTVAEIKNIFQKNGGSLGTPGSTSYIFSGEENAPTFTVELTDDIKQRVLNIEDALEDHDDVQEFYSNYVDAS